MKWTTKIGHKDVFEEKYLLHVILMKIEVLGNDLGD